MTTTPPPSTSGTTPASRLLTGPAAVNSAAQAMKDIVDSSGQIDMNKLLGWVVQCQDTLKTLSEDTTQVRNIQSFSTLTQGSGATTSTRPPPQPKITFSNKDGEKWEDFRKAYENLVEAFKYTEHHAKHYLLGCMRDRAFQMVSHLDHKGSTFEDLMEEYDTIFLPPASSQMA